MSGIGELDVKKTGLNMSEDEKKNVFLAIAVGCLSVCNDLTEGPDHARPKRMLMQLREKVMYTAAPQIPGVRDHNMQIYRDAIIASDKVLQDLVKTQKQQRHVLLNLAGFCMEQLPLTPAIWRKYNALFDCYPDAFHYQDIRSGERIYQRIEAEVTIQVAQRGGTIL